MINHWRTIFSCYGKSPFFDYYSTDLEKLLGERHLYLFDLNLAALEWLREVLRFPAEIIVADSINIIDYKEMQTITQINGDLIIFRQVTFWLNTHRFLKTELVFNPIWVYWTCCLTWGHLRLIYCSHEVLRQGSLKISLKCAEQRLQSLIPDFKKLIFK
jgi:hypothetical protein